MSKRHRKVLRKYISNYKHVIITKGKFVKVVAGGEPYLLHCGIPSVVELCLYKGVIVQVGNNESLTTVIWRKEII